MTVLQLKDILDKQPEWYTMELGDGSTPVVIEVLFNSWKVVIK